METETIGAFVANIDIVIVVMSAYAIAAWLVFDHMQEPAERDGDELGAVDMSEFSRNTAAAKQEPDWGDDVVTRAERMAPIRQPMVRRRLNVWQLEALDRELSRD